MLVSWRFQGYLLELLNVNPWVLGDGNQHLKQASRWFWCLLQLDTIIALIGKEIAKQCFFFFFSFGLIPKTSTGLCDHFPLKVKIIKVQFLKWQGCGSAICSRKRCQRLREGIWERCQDDSTLSPSRLWIYYFNQPGHKNDSHNLPDIQSMTVLCQFVVSCHLDYFSLT